MNSGDKDHEASHLSQSPDAVPTGAEADRWILDRQNNLVLAFLKLAVWLGRQPDERQGWAHARFEALSDAFDRYTKRECELLRSIGLVERTNYKEEVNHEMHK